MPIYEYTCRPCGERVFEKIRPFSDPRADCPQCGLPATRRVSVPAPAHVPGGTNAGYNTKAGQKIRLGDLPDRNEWIEQ